MKENGRSGTTEKLVGVHLSVVFSFEFKPRPYFRVFRGFLFRPLRFLRTATSAAGCLEGEDVARFDGKLDAAGKLFFRLIDSLENILAGGAR